MPECARNGKATDSNYARSRQSLAENAQKAARWDAYCAANLLDDASHADAPVSFLPAAYQG